jgi:pimeloyl-ACP methyl ester carboxylesterase
VNASIAYRFEMSVRAGRAGLIAAIALALAMPASAAERFLPAQTSWAPPPAQAPAKEGLAVLPGTRLWYSDSGGDGEVVVLLHAQTGNHAMWLYQQPALVSAGYRVISYSRRGHYKSDPFDPEAPGNSTDDLRALLDVLGVARAHLVGTAAGGTVAPTFALSYPDRVISLTLASTIVGITDADYAAVQARIIPEQVLALPSAILEMGPSYRAAHPQGVEQWEKLEHLSWTGGKKRQPVDKPLNFASFATIKAPMLLMTGTADLIQPPARMRMVFAKAPSGTEYVTVAEAGHTLFWEQPAIFNSVLLDFLGRHSQAPARAKDRP